MSSKPRIVVIGAGFAGLAATRKLAETDVDILLIDKNNFHTFTPLLYQVATCALDPSAVAYPIRSIFRGKKNIRFLLGEVTEIDYDDKAVVVEAGIGEIRRESYDYLIMAAGSATNYFGNQDIEMHSFGLRDMNDAISIRHHVLRLFEKAAWTEDPELRDQYMTVVVVGGGPTGIETAGAVYELYSNVLDKEYNHDGKLKIRVILLEAMDALLQSYPESLQESAREQLESLGVEVRTGAFVEDVQGDHLRLKDGTVIHTRTIVWATGVIGPSLGEMLNVELSRGNRLPVHPTLEVIDRDGIYAAGDMVYLPQPGTDEPYPPLIPVAQQQGKLVAKNILSAMANEPQGHFKYVDRGTMATIGRSRAVAWVFKRFKLTGFLAWLAWLGLHLLELMGFRNRIQAFLNWVYDYVFYNRSVRFIIGDSPDKQTNPEMFDAALAEKNRKARSESEAA